MQLNSLKTSDTPRPIFVIVQSHSQLGSSPQLRIACITYLATQLTCELLTIAYVKSTYVICTHTRFLHVDKQYNCEPKN